MTNELDIIDPPVTPYSSPEDIKAWIKDLKQMGPTANVVEAIEQSQKWLEWKNAAK